MERVSMEEAARRLGVSVATIRRRLHSGELQGFQEPTSQGFKWLVEISELTTVGTPNKPYSQTDSESPSDLHDAVSVTNGEVTALKETIVILREELEARRREVQELHVLLQHAQSALPAPKESQHSWWHKLWHRNVR